MDSGIFSYIRAFGVRWFVTMSGPLSVPLAVIAYFVQNDAAKIILFTTALLCAVFASYWVWKVEREARIDAESKVNNQETRKNIRVALARFLPEGGRLIEKCKDETVPTPDDDIELWANNIQTLLSAELDESFVRRFLDGSGMIHYITPGQRSQVHIQREGRVRTGLARLNEFIKELSI